MDEDIVIDYNVPTDSPKIIKVVGVGGGGCNAVNHMYNEGIEGVAFLVCNTDSKQLNDSPVPVKLQLGTGLGAGNDPEVGRKAAEESLDEIHEKLNDGTRMVFITAGMGGGTGTGAAPVVARVSKEMDILTVGIVTIPYRWEGNPKIDQALDGVEEISKYVDALIVIKNDKLSEIYGDMTVSDAYNRADDVVLVAAKSIADIITMRGKINLDFNDVRTVLKDGGIAIIGTGYGSGEGRVSKAIQDACSSPLLNSNSIFFSKKVAFCVSYSKECELMMNELDEVRDFMSKFDVKRIETKHGIMEDGSLGDKVKVTLLATGFGLGDIHEDELDRRIERRKEEEEEGNAEREERRRRYYDLDAGSGAQRPRHHLYLFSPADIDNDAVIALVERTPVAGRKKGDIEKIKERQYNERTATPDESAPTDTGAIEF